MFVIYYLASGNSIRFKENKLVYSLNHKPLYLHGLNSLKEAVDKECIVYVVSSYNEIIKGAIECGFKVIESKNSHLGLSYTIKEALSLTKENDVTYYMFMVGDQPYISSESIKQLINKTRKYKPKVASLTCKGVLGNPTCFSKEVINEFDSLTKDQGGRIIFNKYKDDALLVEVNSLKELSDIDYIEDISKY